MPHSPTITVTYSSPNWKSKLNAAFQARNYTRIRIKGLLANSTRSKVQGFTVLQAPAPPSSVPIPYPNIASATILVSLPELLPPVLYAFTHQGYTALLASFDANGAGASDNELFLELR